MKTLLTILQIVYGPAGEAPVETYLVYNSEVACGDALQLVDALIDPAYNIVIARCVPTAFETGVMFAPSAPMSSPRPVKRPWEAI